jgi:malate dehydrogenase
MRKRLSIIGAGNVGASIAQMAALEGLADIVLFDIVKGVPQGKALDIAEACPLWGSSVDVTGTGDYGDTAGSDIIVITAGMPRRPGMSRDELLEANAVIVRDVTAGVSGRSPDAVIIVVTNPMDVMAHLVYRVSGFGHRKVIGMGGILDSARFRTFVARELGVSVIDVEALVLGGHGDQMVPIPRFTTAKGVPITELLSEDAIKSLIERTRNGGAEIVGLLETGSAYYAPAASAMEMIRAILLDEKRMLPCSVYLTGEYGIRDTYAGVPAVIGGEGVEKIVELELGKEEKGLLEKSTAAVGELFSRLESA